MNTRLTRVFQCLLRMFTRSDTSLEPLLCIHLELLDFRNPSTTHLHTISYTPLVIVCRSKSNHSLTTYRRLHYIMLVVATRHIFAFKPLTLARESGFWSLRPIFSPFNRYALCIATSIHNPNGTFNTLHAHFYQSAFHDDGSLNSRGHVNYKGVQRASRSANLEFRCYWWCTYEGTYWSRACCERSGAAQ